MIKSKIVRKAFREELKYPVNWGDFSYKYPINSIEIQETDHFFLVSFDQSDELPEHANLFYLFIHNFFFKSPNPPPVRLHFIKVVFNYAFSCKNYLEGLPTVFDLGAALAR